MIKWDFLLIHMFPSVTFVPDSPFNVSLAGFLSSNTANTVFVSALGQHCVYIDCHPMLPILMTCSLEPHYIQLLAFGECLNVFRMSEIPKTISGMQDHS